MTVVWVRWRGGTARHQPAIADVERIGPTGWPIECSEVHHSRGVRPKESVTANPWPRERETHHLSLVVDAVRVTNIAAQSPKILETGRRLPKDRVWLA